MDYLIDTSILVRAVDSADSDSKIARRALIALARSGHRLCVLPQNLAEFWFVATRPVTSNGLGWSYARAERVVKAFESRFHLLFEDRAAYESWRDLMKRHQIVGRQVFDARLAGAIAAHRVDRALTFDIEHFRRYDSTAVVHPADVEGASV